MTIEEQMYDEIMHKMPHRIAELVKTIDTIHKMLEVKHLGALSDNLDQLKKTLEQAEQEQKDLYENFYDGKHYDLILPQTYNDITEDFIDSGYIENHIDEEADYYQKRGIEVDKSKLETYPYDRFSTGRLSVYDNFFNFSQNDDFKTLCEYYYNEKFDRKQYNTYKGTFKDNYIDENGIFDFKKFCEKTDFRRDVMFPMATRILLGDKVREATEQALETWKEPTKEEQKYKNLYCNKDFENLLPKSYTEMVNGFTDSEYLDETFDSVSDYYTSGENGDWCVEQILENYEPADDPSLDITDNYNYIAQNDDFKTLCEYYYNDEYDIEEEGTFKDNYIDENGIFDFKKFCDKTYFQSDIMHDMDKAILKDDKVYQRMDEIRQSYKEDEQKYYNEKYEDYTTEELKAEMDELYETPIYANSDWEEKIQRNIYHLNMDAMKKTLEREQTQEQDIDTFINSYDDIQATILYTNGDGNHINEIKCISDGKMLTLDVSKMNLASDTSMEKLQQIAKNIIASTKAKDPIIKPEPIKQNNDFER